MQNILVNNQNEFRFFRIIDNMTLPFLTSLVGLNKSNIGHYLPFLNRLRYIFAQPEEKLSGFILDLVPFCAQARYISYQITTFLNDAVYIHLRYIMFNLLKNFARLNHRFLSF